VITLIMCLRQAQLMKAFQKAQKEEDEERDAYQKVRLRQQRQALDKELFNSQRTLAIESKVSPLVRVHLLLLMTLTNHGPFC